MVRRWALVPFAGTIFVLALAWAPTGRVGPAAETEEVHVASDAGPADTELVEAQRAGQVLESAGDLPGALALYEAALHGAAGEGETAPSKAVAAVLVRAGLCAAYLADVDLASVFFERALRADPDNVDALHGAGATRVVRNDMGGASKAHIHAAGVDAAKRAPTIVQQLGTGPEAEALKWVWYQASHTKYAMARDAHLRAVAARRSKPATEAGNALRRRLYTLHLALASQLLHAHMAREARVHMEAAARLAPPNDVMHVLTAVTPPGSADLDTPASAAADLRAVEEAMAVLVAASEPVLGGDPVTDLSDVQAQLRNLTRGAQARPMFSMAWSAAVARAGAHARHGQHLRLLEPMAQVYARSQPHLEAAVAPHMGKWEAPRELDPLQSKGKLSFFSKRKVRVGVVMKVFAHRGCRAFCGLIASLTPGASEVIIFDSTAPGEGPRPRNASQPDAADAYASLMRATLADGLAAPKAYVEKGRSSGHLGFARLPAKPADAQALVEAAELDVLLFADEPVVGGDPLIAGLARLAPVKIAMWAHPHTSGFGSAAGAMDFYLAPDAFTHAPPAPIPAGRDVPAEPDHAPVAGRAHELDTLGGFSEQFVRMDGPGAYFYTPTHQAWGACGRLLAPADLEEGAPPKGLAAGSRQFDWRSYHRPPYGISLFAKPASLRKRAFPGSAKAGSRRARAAETDELSAPLRALLDEAAGGPAAGAGYTGGDKGGIRLYVCAHPAHKFSPEFDAVLLGVLRRDRRAVVVAVWDGQDSGLSKRRTLRRIRTALSRAAAVDEVPAETYTSRFRVLPELSKVELLVLTAHAAVALDPFPSGGAVTTADALVMGVPVVTLPSQVTALQATAGMLDLVGVPELIAGPWRSHNPDATPAGADKQVAEYVELAARVAAGGAFRTGVVASICAGRGALFENLQAAADFERFLLRVSTAMVKPAATPPQAPPGDEEPQLDLLG